MFTRRILALSVAALAVVGGLTACTESTPEAPAAPPSALNTKVIPAAPITIKSLKCDWMMPPEYLKAVWPGGKMDAAQLGGGGAACTYSVPDKTSPNVAAKSQRYYIFLQQFNDAATAKTRIDTDRTLLKKYPNAWKMVDAKIGDHAFTAASVTPVDGLTKSYVYAACGTWTTKVQASVNTVKVTMKDVEKTATEFCKALTATK